MLLPNGSAIKQDVIDCFNKAVANPKNQATPDMYNWQQWEEGINWSFVDADMAIELAYYDYEYVYECFDALVDAYVLDQAAMRLEIMKKDFLGIDTQAQLS